MARIKQSILHGLRNLTRFRGRDARGQFWPFAIGTYLVVTAITTVIGMPILVRSMVQMAARAGPGRSRVSVGPGHFSLQASGVEYLPGMSDFLMVTKVGAAVTVLLLAAAVVRRLHDRGRSGAWGLLPLPFSVGGVSLFMQVADDGGGGLFWLLLLNNLVYFAALGFLISLLVREGMPGANRFGEAPPR